MKIDFHRRTGRKRDILGSKTWGNAKIGADEGPNVPQYTARVRECKKCSGATFNYFQCSVCLQKAELKGTAVAEIGWGF